jgi:hypothetical protein
MNKVQAMIILDQTELDRIDALRIVMNVSRGEVQRQAIADGTGPLSKMEAAHRDRLVRLYRLAEIEGDGDWRLWVRETVKGRKTLPTLEAMEALAAESAGEPVPVGRKLPLDW